MTKDHHPSWDGYTKKVFAEIREIKRTMTDIERKELAEKINPLKK